MGRLSAEQQFLYESRLMHRADYESTIEYANDRGVEKGKMELSLEIAREMKKDNFDISKIAQFTKLSIEEIQNL